MLLLADVAAARAEVRAYPPDRRIAPGELPAGSARALELVAPANGYAAGQIAVRGGGGTVAWSRRSSRELPARTKLSLVARTSVRGRPIPDPLPPLAGAAPASAVLFLRISTHGLAAGTYRGALTIGREALPVTLTVARWSLPPRTGGFRTLFTIQPQSYFNAVDGRNPGAAARSSNRALFSLLADYRIAPGEWGYGTPSHAGYTEGGSFYARRSSNFKGQADLGFNTLRIPLSNQRQASGRWIGGASPHEPEAWSPFLSLVRPFWLANRYVDRAVAWTWDEPGTREAHILARQARSLRASFPEAKLLSTLAPSRANRFLRDGGRDDLDIWSVLSRRFYGAFGRPRTTYRRIRELRRGGKEVWTYTYHGSPGSPGYDATEPLTNARIFLTWNAVERTDGTLYGQGMVSYRGLDPYRALPDHGQAVLIYPGPPGGEPVSSLRLEAIRDGIQDANVFGAYADRFGRTALVRLLGRYGLFRTRGGRLLLGCTRGCDLRTRSKFAWPVWQRDEAKAAAALERARRGALAALSAR